MIIPLTDAQKQVGEVFQFEFHELLEEEEFAGKKVSFVNPCDVSGTYVYDGKGFHIQASATVSYKAECSRCLKEFVETLKFPIDDYFVRDKYWDIDQDSYPYTSEQIDLKPAFIDNLFLNYPMISLCKPDCLGICPVCGSDRNESRCSCQADYAIGKFDVLQQLLNDNKEV